MDPITKYILLQERHPMHRRRQIHKQIQILIKKKTKKCPKSKDPQACNAKYDKKIMSKKKTMQKLMNLRFSSLSSKEKERYADYQSEGVGKTIVATNILAIKTILGISKDKERVHIKKKCAKFKGKEHKLCTYRVKIEMMKRYKSTIPKHMAKCSRTKNPEKCKTFLKKALVKVDDKIKKYEDILRKK